MNRAVSNLILIITLVLTTVSVFARQLQTSSVPSADDFIPSLWQTAPATSAAPPPSGFTNDDDFGNISAQVDLDTQSTNSPSPLVIHSASNDAKFATPSNELSVGSSRTLANSLKLANIATHVPFSDESKGLKIYLSLVKPDLIGKDVGQSNQGLRTYFTDEVTSNPCMQSRASDFYSRIGNLLKDVPPIGRPAVLDTVKSDSRGHLKSGWVWKNAMQAAGNDGGLALTLIGMCGHDDREQSTAGSRYGFRDDSESARHVITDEIDRYTQIKSDLAQQSHGKPTVKSKALQAAIDQKIASLKSPSTHGFTTIQCPATESPYFAPGSLGEGIDIPRDLKNEIVATQNPDGVLTIPAKYYHVYSSAFITCKLIEGGIRPDKAKAVVKEAAKLYRGVRLCETLSDNVIYNVPGYDTAEQFLESPDALKKCRQSAFQKANANVCDISDEADFYRKKIKDPAELRKKIDALFVVADASYLYRMWFVGEKYMGINIPCTDHRRLGGLAGPKDLMSNESDADPNENGFNFHTPRKPRAWTNARYENAKRKIATWLVDSKWTVAQHEVGADFAAQVCKPRSANETLEQAACRINARQASHPAKGTKQVR